MLETVLDEGNYKTSKLPRDPLTFCALEAFKIGSKGKVDHKRTGTEQTNREGMNCLQNFAEIGKALMHDKDEGCDVNLWLKKEIPK